MESSQSIIVFAIYIQINSPPGVYFYEYCGEVGSWLFPYLSAGTVT